MTNEDVIALPWLIFVLLLLVFYSTNNLWKEIVKQGSPEIQLVRLIRLAKQTNPTDRFFEHVFTLEEMFCTAIKNGQGGNVYLYQSGFLDLVDILKDACKSNSNVKAAEIEDSIMVLLIVISHLIPVILDNEMSGCLYRFGCILRRIGEVGCPTEGAKTELALTFKTITKLSFDRGCINELCYMNSLFISSGENDDGEDTLILCIEYSIEQISAEVNKDNAAFVFSHLLTDFENLLQNSSIAKNPKIKITLRKFADQTELIALLKEKRIDASKQIKRMKAIIAKG